MFPLRSDELFDFSKSEFATSWPIEGGYEFELKQAIAIRRVQVADADSVAVEIANLKGQWTLARDVHGIVALDPPAVGRYVRVSAKAGIDRPDRVQILSFPDAASVSCLRQRLRYAYSFLREYRVTGPEQASQTALRITEKGDLGNYIIQIINAIALARRCNYKRVEIFDRGSIRIAGPFDFDGIVIGPYLESGQVSEQLVSGPFFRRAAFGQVLADLCGAESQQIVRELVRPYLMPALRELIDHKEPRELTVHMRSGDIFAAELSVGMHGQPPLAYYRKAVRARMKDYGLRSVRLVYQDRNNPMVEGLETWMNEQGIRFRSQSSSEAADLAALANADHIIASYSGFVHAACLMSRKIESITYFEKQHRFSVPFEIIPAIGCVRRFIDLDRVYIQPEEWRNTSEQRDILLNYPDEAVGIDSALGDVIAK